MTVPLSTALVAVTPVAAPVVTTGGPPGPVVNAPTGPTVVPAALVATVRKKYVVFGASPVSVAETGSSASASSSATTGVIDPNAVLVPYSNV